MNPWSFKIVCDRGVSREIVRHRIASYSQESTRFCNYGKEQFGKHIKVIEPPGLRPEGFGDLAAWAEAVKGAERIYLEMLDRGVKPEVARSVLPTCLKTEVGMSTNFREWRHFLKLRTSSKAHPQMRPIAAEIGRILLGLAPSVFEDVCRQGES